MKRIVTVQDISCVGKCSLTVALPIVSAMGVECAVVPTAVLSTHTAFKGFTFRDLTKDIDSIFTHWVKEDIKFDAIYTGYLGSKEQLDIVGNMFDTFNTAPDGKKTLLIVDPCMADNGKLYAGFTSDFAREMGKMAGKADVVLPNMTEASFMLGIPYKEAGTYDEAYVLEVLKALSELGMKEVVLKGVEYKADNRMGIVSYNKETGKTESYFHEKLPTSFHGTGDIFASVVAGALMRSLTLNASYRLAADYVVEAIKTTVSHEKYNWYGVDFETVMPYLLNRLVKECK